MLLVVVLLLLYAVWPFDSAPDAVGDVLLLGLAAGLFVWVLVRQVRHIMDSRLPEVRAIEALVVRVLVAAAKISLRAAPETPGVASGD